MIFDLKRLLFILIRISISISLLIFLFKQVDVKALSEIIKNADKKLLTLAFVIFFFSYVLCLFRWQMLLKAAGIYLPLKRIIISFSGGIFFSLFLPSTIGGDLVRSVDLSTLTKKTKEVIATVLLDRLSGYVGLVIVALLSVLFGWELIQDKNVFIIVAIITALLIVILFVLFNQSLYSKINKLLSSPKSYCKGLTSSITEKIKESIKNLHQQIYLFRHQKKLILNNLIISLVIQIFSPLIFYIIALSLNIKVSIVYFFVFIPIIGAITLLPISIGGLGLRDAMTIFFFAKAGLAKNLAFAMSLLSFFFILIYGSIGGIVYVFTLHSRRLQHY